MKKFTFLLVFTVSLLAVPFLKICSQTGSYKDFERSSTMKIGYTTGDLSLGLGSSITFIIKGAIQFPTSYLERLKGGKIEMVRLAIAGELTKQDNSIFISRNLTGEPDYVQKVEKLEKGWNDIKLNLPFDITGEELFIGFQYTTAGEVISFDGEKDNNYANWLAHGQKEEDLSWAHQEGGNLNLQAIVTGSNLPQNDVCLNTVVAKKYACPNTGSTVDLIVRNMAAADVNKVQGSYRIEEHEPVNFLVDNLCIKSNDIGIITLKDVMFAQDGIYNLEVKIDKVNEEADEDDTDNSALVENIICKEDYTNRKVLLEQFSTMKCVNCPTAHQTLEKVLKYKRDVVRVIHHSGYGTDILTLPESESYLFFFSDENGGSYYAPAMMLDRTNLAKYGADNGSGGNAPGPAFFIRGENASSLIDHCLSTPALVTIDVDRKYDSTTRLLTVAVSGEIPSGKVERLKGDNICLNIILTEDSILGKQEGAENVDKYYHSHVLRKVLTSVWGDPVEFTGATFHSENYTFAVPEDWVDTKIHVIAFVANTDRVSSNNCPVFNSEEIDLVDAGASYISSLQRKPDIKVYTAFNQLYIDGKYNSAVICDAMGRLMMSFEYAGDKIDIGTLEKGIYFVKIKTGTSTESFKVAFRQ